MAKKRVSTSDDEPYPKVRLIEQPSGEVRELQKLLLLKDHELDEAEHELDELMNTESERVLILEKERKTMFEDKTAAEIRAERLQRRVDELEAELHLLKIPQDHIDQPFEIDGDDLGSELTPDHATNLSSTAIDNLNDVVPPLPSDSPNADSATNLVPDNVQPESKRVSNKAELPSYPVDALLSINAKEWFPWAFEYLNHDLGEDYVTMVETYVELERAKNWAYSFKGISPKDRPVELSKWIINCRYDRRGNEPNLQKHDLARFGETFMHWWNGLQPSWRQGPIDGESAGVLGKEWGSLNTSGKNGWLSVLVCLKWWGIGLGDDRAGSLGDKWREAVADVSFMLNGLIAFVSKNN